jgi:hypothetical protein
MKRASLFLISLLSALTALARAPYVGPPETILRGYRPAIRAGRPLVSTIDMDGRLVVGWVEQQDSGDGLLVSSVTPSGLLDRSRPANLTESLPALFQPIGAPSLAYNGQEVLAAFSGSDGFSASLYVARLDRNLALLDRPPIALGSVSLTAPILPPSVAWNGTDFLVAWADGVTTVRPSGAPAGTLSLAAKGVAWSRVAAASFGSSTRFASVDYVAAVPIHCGFSPAFCTKGVPASSALRALTLDEHGVFNSYASVDVGAVLPLDWLAFASSSTGSLTVMARGGMLQSVKVDPRGNPDIARVVTTLAPGRSDLAAVAGSGSEWLIVYEDVPLAATEPSLFGAFLDEEGKLTAPPVRLTSGGALSPALLPLGNGVYRLTFVRPAGNTTEIVTMLVGSHAPGRTRTIR